MFIVIISTLSLLTPGTKPKQTGGNTAGILHTTIYKPGQPSAVLCKQAEKERAEQQTFTPARGRHAK
jgi:hypothetical protein